MLQRRTTTTSSQYDCIIINTHILRIDDLVGLRILQNAILVDTGGVSECVTSDNSLIRLYRHIHQARNHTARTIDLIRRDIGDDITFFMALENHGDFFQ